MLILAETLFLQYILYISDICVKSNIRGPGNTITIYLFIY